MSKEWRIASMRNGNQAMRRARKSANDWAHCRTGNCKTQSEMSSISQHNVLRCKCGEQRMLSLDYSIEKADSSNATSSWARWRFVRKEALCIAVPVDRGQAGEQCEKPGLSRQVSRLNYQRRSS